MTLNIRSGGVIAVSAQLGDGAQGEIYAVASQPQVVFKKYKATALARDTTLESRLTVMAAHPPNRWREPTSGHVTLTWPTDIVTENGRFAGFLMPAVDVDTTVDLHRVTNPTDRQRASGRTGWVRDFTWRYLLRTAANLAQATDVLHQADVVVGDFNESNVRVTHEARVTLLDCDSMQITRSCYRTAVLLRGRPRRVHPARAAEQADWKTTYRHPSSDLFALAVHVYQLLLEGEHPFRGVWTGTGEKPHEPQLARLGVWAHQDDGPLSPRPAAIPIAPLLPPNIVASFRRAFEDGATNPTSRPTALEWHQALTALEATITTCTVNPAHCYPDTCPSCPWCRHTSPVGQRPLPALKAPAPTPSGTPRTPPTIPRATAASFIAANAPPKQLTPARTAPHQATVPPRAALLPKRRRRLRTIIITVLSLVVAAGATVGGLRLFDKPSQQLEGFGDVAVSPDGKFIAAADNDVYPGRIYIWNTATKRLAATLIGPLIQDDGLDYLAFTPDSKTIIAQSADDPITIWDIATRRLIATISDPRTDHNSCVALSPDGKMLAVCGGASSTGIDDNVYLINVARRSISATLHTTSDNACQSGAQEAAFSPDGKVLAVSALPCNGDARIQLWDIDTQRIITTMPLGYPLVYSHDGSMLLVGDNLVYMRQGSRYPRIHAETSEWRQCAASRVQPG